MSILDNIGNLVYLYLDEINPGKRTNASEFSIEASARMLTKVGGRNWIPVIVREIGEDRYEVIGNSFIYAVAEAAGLERVWCIIADNSDETERMTQVLAGELVPKINLSKASRDEIRAALQYLKKSNSPLQSLDLSKATTAIDEAPRQYWTSLEPIIKLKCGITKGKKLDALKQVFELTPQAMPEKVPDVVNFQAMPVKDLDGMTAKDLKEMAKQKGIKGASKMKKSELLVVLSESKNQVMAAQ